METKICSKCNLEKNLSEFYNSKNTKDKKRPECKDCFKQKAIINYYDNKETRLKVIKIYREKTMIK